ncbi:MAG: transmembrane 220 family protein [Deltaproteobacteria bacterium]|nr:transmembrane 220 family protein [Deltaproteobacteria bacterium]MDQ3299400.1 transmembrane 220 family protein [Myxococcota bacterium]
MKPVPAWFRYLAYVMAALFATCVALQYNDPDPIRWMVSYGVATVISALLPVRREAWIAAAAVGVGAVAWAGYLIYLTWGVIGVGDLTHDMSMKGGAVEEGREAGGLAIVAVWLLAAAAFRRTRS